MLCYFSNCISFNNDCMQKMREKLYSKGTVLKRSEIFKLFFSTRILTNLNNMLTILNTTIRVSFMI